MSEVVEEFRDIGADRKLARLAAKEFAEYTGLPYPDSWILFNRVKALVAAGVEPDEVVYERLGS